MKYFIDKKLYAEGSWWNVCLAEIFWWLSEAVYAIGEGAMGIAIFFEDRLCRHNKGLRSSTLDKRVKCLACKRVVA